MSRFIVVDIETIPHPDAVAWFGPVKPKANLVDPVKIAADVAEKEAARAEGFGLDPDTCVTVAVGYAVVGRGDPSCDVTMGSEKLEKDAIEHLWWEYGKSADTRLVTFYGRQFDLPVLLRRSMYLGLKTPRISLDRYRSPHIDVWDALTYQGALRTAHSLSFYAKRCGFTTLDKVDGADIAALAKAEDWEAIKNHCLSDVGLTHALANKLGLLEVA